MLWRRASLLGLLFATLGTGEPTSQKNLEIVLARCTEDLSWLDDLGFGMIATVYEKCGETSGSGTHLTKPNVGREGGTFLSHIIDRYDALADWTVFSQAGKPSYGYQGHRSGGGHMMNNVRFEDYVGAGELKDQRPLFFVFSTVLIQSDKELHQSFRKGYGEEFQAFAPRSDNSMCGDSEEWARWFQLPSWFTTMLSDLQRQQGAPFPTFDFPATLDLFEVSPAHGVIYFAQGARFAASSEAIRRHPLAYYQRLLTFMEQEDPWAGYYLEWLWWYVLGGDSAPCGDEAAVARQHQAFLAKGRLAVTEAVSYSMDDAALPGDVTFATDQTLPVALGEVVTFSAASRSLFNARVAYTGEGALVTETAAVLVVALSLIFNATSSFNNSTLSLAANAVFSHSFGTCVFAGNVVEVLAGCTMDFTGTAIELLGATFRSASDSSVTLPVMVGSDTVMRLLAGTASNFSTAIILSGAGTLVCTEGSTLAVAEALTLSLIATFTSATLSLAANLTCSGATTAFTSAVLSLAAGVTATFSGRAVTFEGTTLSLASGSRCVFSGATVDFSDTQSTGPGTLVFKHSLNPTLGPVMLFTQSTIATAVTVVGQASRSDRQDLMGTTRRTSLTNYATVVYCGTTQTAALTLGSGATVEFQLGCQVAGTSYSNVLSSLTYSTGSIVAVTEVTSTSAPTYIVTLNRPADLPLEVVSSLGSDAATQTLIEYNNTGTCATAFSNTLINNCTSGYTCSITGTTLTAATCAIQLRQAADDSGDDNDKGLYGLLALLILPLLAILLLVLHLRKKRQPRTANELPPLDYDPLASMNDNFPPLFQPWGHNLAQAAVFPVAVPNELGLSAPLYMDALPPFFY